MNSGEAADASSATTAARVTAANYTARQTCKRVAYCQWQRNRARAQATLNPKNQKGAQANANEIFSSVVQLRNPGSENRLASW